MNAYFRFSLASALILVIAFTGKELTAQVAPPFVSSFETNDSFSKQGAQIADTPTRNLLREGSFQNQVGSAHAINGRWIAVGAGNQSPSGTSNRTGMVFIYERETDGTINLRQELAPSDRNNSRGFGRNLVFHGNTLFVGSSSSGDHEAIYIFERNASGNWTEIQKIDKPNESRFSQFGAFIDTDGSFMIAGTLSDGAYLYVRQATGWQLIGQVNVPGFDGTLSPFVAVLNRQVFAVMSETHVHILRFGVDGFTEIQQIPIPAPTVTNLRNLRIVSSGGTFALSNLNDSGTFNSSGAVYFFDRTPAGMWAPTDTLRPENPVNNTTFGTSLQFDGTRVLIGNYGENKAHLFKRGFNRKWSHVTDIAGEMSSNKTLTNNQPSIAIQDNVMLSGLTSSLDGESYIFTIDTDFEPFVYFNDALRGDPVWMPTVKWFRSLPFNTVGMSFAMSGRNDQGVPETRVFTAPNADRSNQFTNSSTLIANLIATQGGLHWVRPERNAEPYFFISGFPEDLEDPSRAAFFNVGSTVTEIPSNLPNIGGTAAWADLNGNGRLDVVLSGLEGSYFENNRTTRIFLNQGSMQFDEVVLPEFETRNAKAILIYDFFNRGKNDILLVGLPGLAGGSENLLIRNLGDGEFEADPDSPLSVVSSNSFMVTAAMGDLTNNGHMDIVVGGWAGNQESPIGIWWNNGDGTFNRSYFWSVGLAANYDAHVEITDVTNNGFPDILFVGDNNTTASSELYLFLNNGERQLQVISPDLPSMRRGGITTGDITLDGKVEFLAFGGDNKGNPVLTSYRNSFAEQVYTRPDALTNVGVTLNENEQLVIRWDPGNDAITPTEGLTYNVRISSSENEADLDDIVESMSFNTGVLRTKGPGNAGARTEFAMPNIEPGSEVFVSVSAVNQHGFASSFTTTRWNSSNRFVALSDTGSPDVSGEFYPAWVDVNRDGNLELTARTTLGGGSTVGIWTVDPVSGAIDLQEDRVFGRRALWADFNNNGWPDAAYVSSTFVTMALNNEDGTFSDFSSESVNVRVNDFDVIDVDNDGFMEIVIASGSFTDDDSSRVVRHLGDGVLEITDIALPPALLVAVADHNRNGCQDLLLHAIDQDASTDRLAVYANDCNGNFEEVAVLSEEGFVHYAIWGDITANGYPDVLAVVIPESSGSPMTYDIHVYPNQGNGEFGPAVVFDGFDSIRPILADITGNGYLDIVINGGLESNQVRASALLNSGSPDVVFEPAIGIGTYANGMMAAADLFNSGRADIFIGGEVSFGFNSAVGSNLYRNFTAPVYESSGAPVNLNVDIGTDVTFSWAAGDQGTTPADGVTYNLRVGTQPGGNDVVSSLALENGKRLVARAGNAGSATSITLRNLLPNTTYYWSVQTIDNLYNGSAFAEEQSFVSSPVSIDGGIELPVEVTLSQNYPNPFNPSTSIRFGLPVSDQVRISVYDITGRLVSQITDARFDAGYHVVSFDGSRLASGVYLYRLETGGTVLTQKMSLIK